MRWGLVLVGSTAAVVLLAPIASADCPPGILPQPEVCNCFDDDCDGVVDDDPGAPGNPAWCKNPCTGTTWATCITTDDIVCQCAWTPSCGDEFPCGTPGQTIVQDAHKSGTNPPESVGAQCWMSPKTHCPDCTSATTISANKVECAPLGTVLDGGSTPPVCVCKVGFTTFGQESGCRAPCFGVVCPSGGVCTDYGPNAGRCVIDNCFNVPCPVGKACDHGTCIDNPCKFNTCAQGLACKPSTDFSTFKCEPSCATIVCALPTLCSHGVCVEPECAQTCDQGTVCSPDAGCVADPCMPSSCPDGAHCDPNTGTCGNWPCEGVVCPAGQLCKQGECEAVPMHDAGIEGGDADAHADADDAKGEDVAVEANKAPEDAGFFDVTSGGVNASAPTTDLGGCACTTGGVQSERRSLSALMFALMFIAIRRRSPGSRCRSKKGAPP